jgi:hypothetical protein
MQERNPDMPSSPGGEPAEGRPDMELPGADRDDPGVDRQPPAIPNPDGRPADREPPDDPNADLPERLGQRIQNGAGTGIAAGEPDLVPDVEVSEETM